MIKILPLADLYVPTTKIMEQANGDIEQALLLAASYGFAQACKDLQNSFTYEPNDD